ncbi:hypothetical protein [Erythrobacter alti]|uniref:anti-sigma factor family protein n=1 Tax=Erythrobacter alti TaxID=1896145 RepID=UPI0030F4740C
MSNTDITQEELAAWADGEISGARALFIKAAVANDSGLQAQVEAHRALKDRLSAHFAPIAEQPVPDRLADLLRPKDAEVVDFAAAKTRLEEKRRLPRWSWIAGPALAASLALAVFLPRTGDDVPGDPYAGTQLAAALDTQLVADQDASADTRILLSFQNNGGEFCRAYAGSEAGGIACRDDTGWRIETMGSGSETGRTEFRQAGAAQIMAAAQDMAAGDALDADAEAAAREAGWQAD